MTIKTDLSILFLAKKHEDCYKAIEFARKNFVTVSSYLGEWGDPFPREAESWQGDLIISYLSRWIVPEQLLKQAKIASINFHPATPDFPGFACHSFALYEESTEYGVTCHHMHPKVDTGDIIAVRRFPVFPTDNVNSLITRTYAYQLVLFYEIMGLIINRESLPSSDEAWSRTPFTKGNHNDLMKITPDMEKEEISRRVRATSYGIWQPSVHIGGFDFELKTEEMR